MLSKLPLGPALDPAGLTTVSRFQSVIPLVVFFEVARGCQHSITIIEIAYLSFAVHHGVMYVQIALICKMFSAITANHFMVYRIMCLQICGGREA